MCPNPAPNSDCHPKMIVAGIRNGESKLVRDPIRDGAQSYPIVHKTFCPECETHGAVRHCCSSYDQAKSGQEIARFESPYSRINVQWSSDPSASESQ